jgi:hypothetical protein
VRLSGLVTILEACDVHAAAYTFAGPGPSSAAAAAAGAAPAAAPAAPAPALALAAPGGVSLRLDPGSYAALMRVAYENFMELHSTFDAGSVPPRPPPAWNAKFEPAPRFGLALAALRPLMLLTLEAAQLKARARRRATRRRFR